MKNNTCNIMNSEENSEQERLHKIKNEMRDLKNTTDLDYIFRKLYKLLGLNGKVEAEYVRNFYIKKRKNQMHYFAPHTPYINDELGWETRYFMDTGKFSKSTLKPINEIIDDIPELLLNAKAMLGLGKWRTVIDISNIILDKEPQNIPALLLKIESHNRLKEFNDGLNCTKIILSIDETNKFAFNMQNFFLSKLNRTEELLAIINKNNSSDKEKGNTMSDYLQELRNFFHHTASLEKLNRIEDAISVCDKYIINNPDVEDGYNKKIKLLEQLGRYEEILPIYEILSKLTPRARYYHLKCQAEILIKLKNFQKAILLCNESLNIKFKEYTIETRARAQRYLDNPELSKQCNIENPKLLLKHRSVSSSNIESIGYDEDTERLEILFKTNKNYMYFEVPRNIYEELIGSSSVGSYFHSNILGKFRYEKIETNTNEVENLYEQTRLIVPKDAKTWRIIGNKLAKKGDTKNALSCYEKALEIDPKDAKTWAIKGAILEQQGNLDEASTCYEKAKNLGFQFPNNE